MRKRTVQDTDQEAKLFRRRAGESAHRFLAAAARVGTTPKELLRWVMNFAKRDLPGQEALRDAWWEVWAFSHRALAHGRTATTGTVVHRADDDDHVLFEPPFSEHEIPLFQMELRKCLDELRNKHVLWFPAPVIHGIDWYPKAEGATFPKPGVYMVARGGRVQDIFYPAFLHLFVQAGPDLQTCARPGCGNFFLVKRSHHKYCSKQCENMVAVAKYRQTHPDLPDRQHERYKRKRQAGRNVQVVRRPRKKRLAREP